MAYAINIQNTLRRLSHSLALGRMRRAPVRIAAALFGALLLAVAGGFHRAQARDYAPPNILVILVDDLGYGDLGYTGAADAHTPNIDRLAREGIAFPNGYVPSPVCSPSRAGLLTGRHPSRFGLDVNIPYAPADESVGLPLSETLLPEYLRQAGYRTGVVGKWHLGAADPYHPLRRGFDWRYGYASNDAYYRANTALNPAALPLLPPAERSRDTSGFGKHLTTRLTARAISFATESSRPFFLYLAYDAAHTPHLPAAKTAQKYAHIRDEQRRAYLARVDELDFNIGWLMNSLKESGQWRNTIVFFLSDNGGDARYADNLPLRSGKRSLYEGGIRVPFAASWPIGWPQGATYDPPVSSLDIAATALAMAGGAIDPALPLDGVNLDPFIRGALPGNPHDALFWRAQRPDAPTLYRFAVRGGGESDFKLIREDFGGATELFNLGSDADETRDLADRQPDKATELAELWDAWNAGNAPDSAIPTKSPSPPPDSFTLAHSEKAALADALDNFQPGDYGYPAARSSYDVYIDGKSLLYIKQECAPQDTYERFYLHIFPRDDANLPANRRELGFVGYNFRFSAAGVMLGDACIAKAPLPYYGIARIRTGQYSGANQVWRAEFAPP